MARNYKRIPFAGRRSSVAAFPGDPSLSNSGGDNLMDGLPRINFRGDSALGACGAAPFANDPAMVIQGSGDNLMDGLPRIAFRGDRALGSYDPDLPGGGLAGTINPPPGVTKVVVRPEPFAAPGWPGFFGWVAKTHPDFYNWLRVSLPNFVEDRQSFTSAGAQLGAMGDDPISLSPITIDSPTLPSMPAIEGQTDNAPMPTTTASSSIFDTIAKGAAAFLPLVQQQQIMNVQLQRAKNGQPPLNIAAYSNPNAGLNVGLNPATQKTLMLVAGGLGAVFLAHSFMKRR